MTRFAFLIWACALSIPADTLRLRDGSTVSGDFLGGTAQDIRFSVNGEVRHYPRASVAEVTFSTGQGDISGEVASEPDWVLRGPDYVGAPFLRGASGYIPLEREVAMASRSGGIYGMGPTVYRVRGARSPVRVRQGDRIVFVVRLDSGGDPHQFQLYRLDSRMNYRQTQPVTGGMPPALPVRVQRISSSVYEITPARALYPGEYAVSPANSNDSYCFGVDY
ncbi:MAG TPA: hypothetical protein VKX45_14545 [Bryobacteraceae bacterium]|jgi:hypothetical protein|nr:hypothetical protein [Bryobacteraceae bacterium]